MVPPVGGEHSLKSPFAAEDAGEELCIFGGSDSVDDVVGSHDHPGIGLFDGNLEGFEVDLAQGPLAQAGVGLKAVGLLVVAGKVLGTGADLAGLDASDKGSGHFAGQKGIFGVVFEIPPAEGTAVDIHGGRQPDTDVVFFDFHAACAADFLHEFLIPGAGQEGGTGKGCGGKTDFRLDAETGGTVRSHDRGNAVGGEISHAESIGDAGVGLAAEQADPVFQGQPVKKALKIRAPVRHLHKPDRILCAVAEQVFPLAGAGVRRENTGFFQAFPDTDGGPVFLQGQGFKGSVRKQARRKCGRRAEAVGFLYNDVLCQFQNRIQAYSIAYAGTQIKGISSLLQNPGTLADPAQVIKGSQIGGRDAQADCRRLPGLEKGCLAEGL